MVTAIVMRMDWVNVSIVSLSMSVDAMVVGSTDGLRERHMSIVKALLIAATFGLFQFGMPVLGYFVGYSFREALTAAIPWIAFALLSLLSAKSLVDFVKDRKNKDKEEVEERKIKPMDIFFQGIATSIDALCIGFVFLGYAIPEAMLSFGVIGVSTFTLSFLMVMLGKFLGSKVDFFRDYASLISAITFLAVGIKILLEGIL